MISQTILFTFVFFLSLKFSVYIFYIMEVKSVFLSNQSKYFKLRKSVRKLVISYGVRSSIYLLLFFLTMIYSILIEAEYISHLYGVFITCLLIIIIIYAFINLVNIDNFSIRRTRLFRKVNFNSYFTKEMFLFKIMRLLYFLSNASFILFIILVILN